MTNPIPESTHYSEHYRDRTILLAWSSTSGWCAEIFGVRGKRFCERSYELAFARARGYLDAVGNPLSSYQTAFVIGGASLAALGIAYLWLHARSASASTPQPRTVNDCVPDTLSEGWKSLGDVGAGDVTLQQGKLYRFLVNDGDGTLSPAHIEAALSEIGWNIRTGPTPEQPWPLPFMPKLQWRVTAFWNKPTTTTSWSTYLASLGNAYGVFYVCMYS